MKTKPIKIERRNITVRGHNGFGRYDLKGADDFCGITRYQAEQIIGRSVMQVYDRFCSTIEKDEHKYGVELRLEFTEYEKD